MSDRPRSKTRFASSSVGQGSKPSRAELEHLLTRVIDRINASPEKAAIILTEWTRKGSNSSGKSKKRPA